VTSWKSGLGSPKADNIVPLGVGRYINPPLIPAPLPPPAVVSTHYQTLPLVTFCNYNPIKLTQDTYPIWLPQIVPHLKGGNVYGYVDGSFSCPPPTISSTTDGITSSQPNPSFLHWTMQDQIILGAINSALTEKMLTHVTRCTTSKAAWTPLETLFTSHTKAHTMQVHIQLASLKKGNSTIADYFQKFQALVDALAIVGKPIDDFEHKLFSLLALDQITIPLSLLSPLGLIHCP
jgi:hypothetical protein